MESYAIVAVIPLISKKGESSFVKAGFGSSVTTKRTTVAKRKTRAGRFGPELREDNFRARYNNSCERGISWLVGTVTTLERRNKSSTLGCAAAKNITSPLRGRVKTQTRKQRGGEKNGDGRHMGVGEHLWRRGISKAVARRVVREQCARTMRATTRSHSGKVGENNRNDDF